VQRFAAHLLERGMTISSEAHLPTPPSAPQTSIVCSALILGMVSKKTARTPMGVRTENLITPEYPTRRQ
jgi:hypothetical protein